MLGMVCIIKQEWVNEFDFLVSKNNVLQIIIEEKNILTKMEYHICRLRKYRKRIFRVMMLNSIIYHSVDKKQVVRKIL